ncbi:hypothetical protein U1Q18_024938, partial [Sarracenia purpurea var. burkii]
VTLWPVDFPLSDSVLTRCLHRTATSSSSLRQNERLQSNWYTASITSGDPRFLYQRRTFLPGDSSDHPVPLQRQLRLYHLPS